MAVTSGLHFVVTVDVQSVTPGRRVSVALEEKRGEGPARLLQTTETPPIEGGRTAFISFQLALQQRGTVLLFATAQDDAGVHYHPDGTVVEVL